MILELTFAFAITGRAIDLSSTQRCIGNGSCHEINRVLGRFNNPITFAAVQAGTTGLAEIAIYKLSKEHPKLAILSNLVVGGIFTGIGIHNYNVSKRAIH